MDREPPTLTSSVKVLTLCDITSCSLWQVPCFLLTQVRHMNQASNQKQLGLTKTTRRLLRRKHIKNDGNQVRQDR